MTTSSSDNNTDIIEQIRTNMEHDYNQRTHRARKHLETLTDAGKKDLIDSIIEKHKSQGTNPREELEFYLGNDMNAEQEEHKEKMKKIPGLPPMIRINYGGKNGKKYGGKKGKTQRKNKKSKKSKTQRKIKKTKKSKTRKSTRRRR